MSKPIKHSRQDSRLILEELEQRRLFSAGAEGLIDPVDEPDADPLYLDLDAREAQAEAGGEDAAAAEQQSHEVVFIDAGVDNYQMLVDDIRGNMDSSRDLEVVVLDRDRDGIEQISEYLREYSDLDAVHIISHGSDGSVELGNSSLDTVSLEQNKLNIALWANAFSDIGDILIYGCDLAASETGRGLIDELGALTLTDVAASDDLTGAGSQGGDWLLEYRAGNIDSAVAVSAELQQEYQHTLATYTVTTLADSGAGSLRQAIIDANASGSNDTIEFAVSGTITLGSTGLPTISDRVDIDATTAPGYAGEPLVTLDGSATGASTNGFRVDTGADGSSISGLAIVNFPNAGIRVEPGVDSVSITDNWIGTTGTGTTGDGNASHGIIVRGSNTVITGNVITNNGGDGIEVLDPGSTGSVIQGNIIGLDPDGSTGSGNASAGIDLQSDAHDSIIGGTAAGEGNVISANGDNGITIGSDNNIIQGNYIGTDITGALNRGNIDDGIDILSNGSNNLIGGTAPGAGNLVAYQVDDGIDIDNGTGNSVLGNQVFGSGDNDFEINAAANNGQTAPVLSSAEINTGGQIEIAGSLASSPNSFYRIEFFGKNGVYLGFTNVATDGAGNAAFVTSLTVDVNSGTDIIATATASDAGYATFTDTSTASSAVNTARLAPYAFDDPGDFSTEVQNLNPLGYWRLGDGGGGAADLGSVANGGTYNGVTLGQAGAIGGDTAAYFDGSAYVEIAHDDAYLIDEGTIQAWFNVDDATAGRQHIFSKDSSGLDTGGHISMAINGSGQLEVRLQDTSGDHYVTSTVTVTAGVWHHAAFSFGADGMQLYLDGVLVDSDTYTGGLGTSSGGAGNFEPIAIGAGTRNSNDLSVTPVTELFTGSIDEVALFDTQLDAQTILQIANARGNTYEVGENSSLSVAAADGVLVNDYDEQSDPLSVFEVNGSTAAIGTQITLPSGALLTMNANGSFDYDPNGQFDGLLTGQTGSDSFTYTLSDGNGGTDSATVTITIQGADDAPVIGGDDTGEVTEDVGVSGGFIGTGGTLTVADADAGQSGTQAETINGTYGDLTIDAAGNWTYSADNSQAAIDTLMAGETLTDTFTVTTIDGTTHDIMVTINGSNDAPVNNVPTTQTLIENNLLVFSTANGNAITISDVDAGSSPLEVTLSVDDGDLTLSQVDGLTFLAGDSGDATMTFVGTLADINAALEGMTFDPSQNFNGAVNLQIQTSDLGSETYGRTTVAGTMSTVGGNDKEMVGTRITVDEDGVLNSITAYLYLDKNSSIAFALYSDTAGEPDVLLAESGGVSQLAGTNWYTIDLPDTAVTAGDYWISMDLGGDGAYFYDLTGGETRFNDDNPQNGLEDPWISTYASNTQSISAYANITPDVATPQTDTDVVVINVTPVNNPPVLDTAVMTIDEGQTLTLTPANFAITDPDDTSFTYTVSGVSGGIFQLTGAPATPITSFTSAQLLANEVEFVDDGDEIAPAFSVMVNDGDVDSNTLAATVTYNPQNDAPVLDTAVMTIDEGETLTLTPANFGITDPDDTSFTYTVSGISGGIFQLTGAPGTPITSFTSAQLIANEVEFVDDGDEIAPAFSVTVNDGTTDSNTLSATVTYSGVNDAPDAIDDAGALDGNEDTTSGVLNATLLANDLDVDGDTLSITHIDGTLLTGGVQSIAVTNGTVNVDASDNITFTPDTNYVGAVSFSYTVSDGNGGTDTATVSGTISNVNDAPDAIDDAGALDGNEDTTSGVLNATLLANDLDVDGDTLSITHIDGTLLTGGVQSIAVTNGTVNVDASDNITFTPDTNYVGAVSFSYTVSDGNGGTDTATVSGTISNVNDAPDAIDDAGALDGNEDTTSGVLNATLLANDLDVDGDTLSITHIDGTLLTGGVQSIAVTNGTVNVDASDNITFTPDTNYVGAVSFSYTVSDGNGGTDTATVSGTISNVNDAPDAIDDAGALDGNEDTTSGVLNATLLANDLDVDGDTLSITHIDGTLLTGGVQSIAVTNGTVNVDASDNITFTPDTNYVGAVSFSYTVSDGNGGTDTATVSGTISNVNDAPDAIDDAGALDGNEDTTSGVLNATLLANDLDVDGDTLSITHIDGTLLTGGVQSIAVTNGTVNVDASDNITFTPDTNYVGAVSFSYTVSDGNGGTDTATVSGTISNVNDAPDAIDDAGALDGNEDTTSGVLNATLLANDLDVDGDTLSITHIDGTLLTGGVQSIAVTNGTVNVDASDNITFTPDTNYVGAVSFSYTVSDGNGGTDTATVSGTISNVNDAPVITPGVVTGAIIEGGTVSQAGSIAFTDLDLTDAPTATEATQSITTGLVLTPAQQAAIENAFTISPDPANTNNGTINWDYTIADADLDFLANGDTITVVFRITVDDGNGGSSTQDVTINITGSNDAPVIGGTGSGSVSEDVGVSGGNIVAAGSLTISDPDAGESSFVATTVNGLYGNLVIDAAGNWQYTADNGLAEIQALIGGETIVDTLTVTTADGSTYDVVITIIGNNDSSTASSGPGGTPTTGYVPPEDDIPTVELPDIPEVVAVGGFEPPLFEEIESMPQDRGDAPVEGLSALSQSDSAPQAVEDVQYASVDDDDRQNREEPPAPERISVESPLDVDNLGLQVSDDEAVNERFEQALLKHLDRMHFGIDGDNGYRSADDIKVQVLMGTTATLTAGIVSWVLRGGSLLASLMSTVPLLNRFDPLPILKNREDREEVEPDDDDTEITGPVGEQHRRVDEMFSAKQDE